MIQQLRIPFVRPTYAKPAYAHTGFPAEENSVGNARSDPQKTVLNPASTIPITNLG